MKHLPRSQTKIMLSLAAVLLFVSVGVYAWLFMSLKEVNITSSRRLNKTEAQIQAFFNVNAEKKIFESLEQERFLLSSAVIEEKETVNFFEIVESTASRAGVEIDISDVSINKTLMIEIEASGDFASVYTFLSAMENLPLNLYVHRASLAQVQDEREHHEEDQNVSEWQGNFKFELRSFIPQS